MFPIVLGFLSAVAIYIILARLGSDVLMKLMGYPALTSTLVVCAMVLMLHGSVTGLVAAVIGGLCFELFITLHRRWCGYSKVERNGFRMEWVNHQGGFHKFNTDWLQGIRNYFTNVQQTYKAA